MATRFAEDDRILPPECGFNLRDFGGYATETGGRVKRGKLYRAGVMADVGGAGRDRLGELGIAAICDLRSSGERDKRPTRWHEGLGVEYWARDYGHSRANLAATLEEGRAHAEAMRTRMIDLYRDIAFEHAASYRVLFDMLADEKVPLIVNCSAGKDRTGTAAALVLSALGVSRETIFADYVLTERANFAELWDRMGSGDYASLSTEALGPLIAADPVYLETLFDALEARCGSVLGFIEGELGVGKGQLERMRTHLVDG